MDLDPDQRRDFAADDALGNPAALTLALQRHGTAILRGLLPAAPLVALREVVVDFARRAGWVQGLERDQLVAVAGARLAGSGYDDPRWVQLQQHVLPHPAFHAVRGHPRIDQLLSIAFDGVPFLGQQGDICRLLLPGAPDLSTRPHQDRFYIAGDTPLWTVWCPLVDSPPEVGSLQLWPGSHRLGLLPHAGPAGAAGVESPTDITPIAPHLTPGDAVIFSALTVHGSTPNLTGHLARVSVDYRFAGAPHSG